MQIWRKKKKKSHEIYFKLMSMLNALKKNTHLSFNIKYYLHCKGLYFIHTPCFSHFSKARILNLPATKVKEKMSSLSFCCLRRLAATLSIQYMYIHYCVVIKQPFKNAYQGQPQSFMSTNSSGYMNMLISQSKDLPWL